MKTFNPGDIVTWKPFAERSSRGTVIPCDAVIQFGPNRHGEYYLKKISRYGGLMRKTLRVNAKYLELKHAA